MICPSRSGYLTDPMRLHLHAAVLFVVLSGSAAFAVSGAECVGDQKPFAELQADKSFTVEGPFTVAEIEAKHMIPIRETGKVVPFGNSRERWNTFKGTMLDGDQFFSLAFRVDRYQMDGLALVQTGCLVKFILVNADY